MANPAGTKTVEEAKKAKQHQRTHPPPRNENVRDVVTQKARESGIVPSDSKSQGFGRKVPNETIVPRGRGKMPEAKLMTNPKL